MARPVRTAALGPEGFQDATGVSRETLARLELYAALLEKWNAAMNLVARSSLGDLWRRHMLDSAQLLPLLPPAPTLRRRVLVDLGSGAGFPGLVLAILGAGEVHLVEADQRKVQFLRTVAREVGSDAHIHGVRIEAMKAFEADVVTARALAPLPRLMRLAAPYLETGAIGLFLKGRRVEEELTGLPEAWTIPVERLASRSDPQGTILRVGDLH
jgi:16S rRNA (guanine527-N7)-methyltransferase